MPDPRARPASEVRLFGRSFDRLSLRLGVGVALLVVAPLGLGLYALSRHHFDRAVAAQHEAVELQTRLLEVALRHQMMEQDTTLMASVLREIGAQPSVRGAMILDHRGEVRIASDPARVGEVLPRDSPACYVCHAVDPAERERWTVLEQGGEGEVLRSVLPIENRAECHVCHPAGERLNGILILDTSLAAHRAELELDGTLFLGGAVLLAVLILGSVGWFVRRLILTRLGRLGSTARSIAAGELERRVPLEGEDVITALASDFNCMADHVGALVSEVREREAQLESIMDSLDDGLVVLDGDSRVVAANRSFGRRLGVQSQTLHGRCCSEQVGNLLPCCTSGQECPARRCMVTGEVQRAVFHGEPGDGGRGVVEEVYASPVFDEEGQVVQVVEIWRDITERVEEEQRLAEIEHLVSLGTLASGFSHEVNTPLASMLTCAESALGQIDEQRRDGRPAGEVLAALREHATVIRDQVLRCRRVTEQFLRFSRGIPPSIEPLDLRQVVDGVVSLVEPTARQARVTLERSGDGPVPAVRANAEVVQHALLNLLVNAIQSCGERGGHVRLELAADGPDVRLSVRDDGCGIAPEARAHLFQPFHTRKRGGTGLGLFLSRSFLRRFGGDVRLVSSTPGAGSCFEVRFAGAPEPVS